MNILITVLGFGRSGGYRVLSKLADELINLNHNVYFLSPDSSKDLYFPTKAKILWTDRKRRYFFFESEEPYQRTSKPEFIFFRRYHS
jgi:hypothetical protein